MEYGIRKSDTKTREFIKSLKLETNNNFIHKYSFRYDMENGFISEYAKQFLAKQWYTLCFV